MKQFLLFLLVCVLASCGGPEPRRPVKVKSGSFNASVERSKKLLALEESMINSIIAKDTLHQYQNSAAGAWYYYEKKNENTTYTPQPDDLVTFAYNIISFANDTIYSQEEIGVQKYKVDKQELFPGLRNSIKLLKENESATFLFPSSLAYGYHGDNEKVGINVPVKSTITLFKIEKQQDSIQN
ncbi:gliding motility-associated peptidyl-prolyl isomerase GldI [Maribacter sp. HTCC2170]|uniref:gliding motility-associated peptidyl-prolyl isomerase GldI n=1 Tax=Maribacter sp. (strain HTCC2170 / KCCM 42371) TaxID=313603 RepID=UPI00006B4929|nr:gliding motility-associated peptidyl-prolyl isomerase GldI [Maribacter sp. HTCC2170]EAR01003.1 putative peptidyl-prolylisomerase [Maribacter sp. HTCC2170]